VGERHAEIDYGGQAYSRRLAGVREHRHFHRAKFFSGSSSPRRTMHVADLSPESSSQRDDLIKVAGRSTRNTLERFARAIRHLVIYCSLLRRTLNRND